MAIPDPPAFDGFEPLSPDWQQRLNPEGWPQLFSAEASTTASAVVICLHGFTGMTFEVNPVARACARPGMDGVTLLLPGHGYGALADQRRQFARITPEGLLTATRQTLAIARQRYQRVGIFGQSMGGAIALIMAAEGQVDACAVSAAALRLPRQAELLIPLLSWVGFYLPNPKSTDLYLPSYEFYHSRALRTLWQISRRARACLPQVQSPVYAAHSRQDDTIPPVVLEWIQAQVPTPLQISWLNHSGHCIPVDVDGEILAQQVAGFMERYLLLKPEPSGQG